jgi:hypothetical protein
MKTIVEVPALPGPVLPGGGLSIGSWLCGSPHVVCDRRLPPVEHGGDYLAAASAL